MFNDHGPLISMLVNRWIIRWKTCHVKANKNIPILPTGILTVASKVGSSSFWAIMGIVLYLTREHCTKGGFWQASHATQTQALPIQEGPNYFGKKYLLYEWSYKRGSYIKILST